MTREEFASLKKGDFISSALGGFPRRVIVSAHGDYVVAKLEGRYGDPRKILIENSPNWRRLPADEGVEL